MLNRSLYALIVACWSLLSCITAVAHESRPLLVEIIEQQPASYQVKWRVPASVPLRNSPRIELPVSCRTLQGQASVSSLTGSALYRCEQPLSGRVISVHYPDYNPSISSLVQYRTLSGERHTQLLGPQENQWTVPDAETATNVAKSYTLLGIEHIWAGLDHLLFVVCLLWIAGTGKRILVTITGFTLAHSITLTLAAVDVVRLPIPPVEAVIALSIVFLATEIVKDRKHTLTWRYPIAVSSSFGLLHGFGFAAALEEIGLPQTELLTGLLFFNIGVEIGQILFATAVISFAVGLKWILLNNPLVGRFGWQSFMSHSRVTVSYVVGSLASYWLVERCVSFWSV